MGNSKVIFGNETLIDLTGDTVTPDTLLAGTTAHNRSGEQIVGTATVPDTLDDLTDVDFTSPAEGDLLQYDATEQKWVNSAKIPQKVAGLQKTGCVNVLQNDATSRVLGGVTWTVDSDKIIQANGTATTRNDLLIHGTEGSYTGELPAGTWKMVGCPAGGSDTTYWWQIRYKDGNGNTHYANETGNGLIISWESTYRYDVIRCFVGGGTTADNLIFKLMLTPDLSATYADYVPHSMTNRELTEAVATTTLDAFDLSTKDPSVTVVYNRAITFGKVVYVALTFTVQAAVGTSGIVIGKINSEINPYSRVVCPLVKDSDGSPAGSLYVNRNIDTKAYSLPAAGNYCICFSYICE